MTQKISSSRTEFEKRMLELYKTKQGYWPAKEWFERVEVAQQPLRQRLGGVRLVLPVAIDNAEMPAPIRDVEPLFKHLRELLGDSLFREQKLTVESFQFANTTMISQDPRIKAKKIGVGKMISHHVDKFKSNYGPESIKAVHKIVSQLGVIWARARQEKYKLFVNVTTSPLAFACIGHYGPDQNSCFGQCRENYTHKLGIGVYPNSAVILISEEELEDGIIYHSSYVARWFMFTNPDFSRVNTFNYYPRGGIVEGNMLFAMRKMAEHIIGQTELEVAKNKFFIEGIYHNNRGGPLHMNLTYGKNVANIDDWGMKISPIAYGHTQCPKCRGRTFTPDEDGEFIDGIRMCPHCVSVAPRCDVSGVKSYALVRVLDSEDHPVNVCKAIAHECVMCYDGRPRIHKDGEFGLYKYRGRSDVIVVDRSDGCVLIRVPKSHITHGKLILVGDDTVEFPYEKEKEKEKNKEITKEDMMYEIKRYAKINTQFISRGYYSITNNDPITATDDSW